MNVFFFLIALNSVSPDRIVETKGFDSFEECNSYMADIVDTMRYHDLHGYSVSCNTPGGESGDTGSIEIIIK